MGFSFNPTQPFSYLPDSVKDYIPGVGDSRATEKANEANLAESALNRQFQKEMSNTAYQRAMDDMKKAGLNPMLAFSQGGASSPSGSTATVAAAPKTGLANMALQATTGIGSLQNQSTGLQQQQTMNESAIKLNATSAAKNLQQAEQLRLDNVRKKKYEPLDSGLGRISSKIGKSFNGIMDMIDGSAKAQSKRWDDATKKIKVLGPVTGKERSVFDNVKKHFMAPKP